MAFCHVQWYSKVLEKQVGTYVILPDVGKPPYATFYLLHGLSDDYTMWQRRTRIEWHVRELPLIVVMPDGFRSFYTNNDVGPQYHRYISEELVQFVERTFPAKRDRKARSIGGLSMGGYGALRQALACPDVFGSVNSHSGALLYGSGNYVRGDLQEFRRIFGARPKGTDHDLVYLASQAKASGQLPKILIDCGTEDHLLEQNRKFHSLLEKMQIPHEYAEHPGAHTWDYWEVHIQEALQFHARNMRLKCNGKR